MKQFALIALALSLVGCASKRATVVTSNEPRVALSKREVGRVRVPDYVERIEVGRYVDKTNPELMHEGHPVYQITKAAQWDLRPNSQPIAPGGPVVGLNAPMVRPIRLSEENRALAQQQKDSLASLHAARANYEDARQSLSDKVVVLRDNSDKVVALEKTVADERKARLAAESKLAETQERLRESEKVRLDADFRKLDQLSPK